MKKLIAAALLGTTLLCGAAAYAAQDAQNSPVPPPRGGPMMHADANKDGVLSRDEVLADVSARFARIDSDKDGKITREERRAFRAARFAARGERDGDGDGMRGPGRPGMHGRDHPGGPDMRGPGGPDGSRVGGHRLHDPDANGDGTVTLDEQRAEALKRFALVDRNGDGRIDPAERDLLRDTLMAFGPRGGHGPHGRHGGFGGRHHGFGGDMPPPPPPADAPGNEG